MPTGRREMRIDLRAHLLTVTALTAEIGTSLFAGNAGDSPGLPYVVMSVVGSEREYTHNGAVDGRRTQIQFDCFAATNDKAELIMDLITAELSGKESFDKNDTHFASFFEGGNEFDDIEDRSLSGGFPDFRKSADFLIAWQPVTTL